MEYTQICFGNYGKCHGTLVSSTETYTRKILNQQFVFEDLKVLRCSECNRVLLPSESNFIVENVISEWLKKENKHGISD